jgi:hypothetical protein
VVRILREQELLRMRLPQRQLRLLEKKLPLANAKENILAVKIPSTPNMLDTMLMTKALMDMIAVPTANVEQSALAKRLLK